jgi:hypothetical protein
LHLNNVRGGRWKNKKTPDEAENGSCLQKDTAISLLSSIVIRGQLIDRQTHRGGDGGGFLPIGHRVAIEGENVGKRII